jgi:hypothetical protein
MIAGRVIGILRPLGISREAASKPMDIIDIDFLILSSSLSVKEEPQSPYQEGKC